ncbi:DELLA protein RGL2 [Abeliophyllum distichum]|uniref:DELLA protein RGL2 n=1 Tax=Abeliophyllum distichum TaxID=126358 RepID=A0ABD1PMX7_9LAMI
MNEIFHTEQIAQMEISDEYSLSKSSENLESESLTKQNGYNLDEVWGDSTYMDSFTSDYHIDQKLHQFANFESLDDLYLDIISPPIQSFDDEIINRGNGEFQDSEVIESENKSLHVLPSTSLEILTKYGSRLRSLNRGKINVERYRTDCNRNGSRTLSTETIIRLAAEEFIQSSSQSSCELSVLSHPYASEISGQVEEDFKELKLLRNLLSCAEKVGEEKYERARRLLLECDKMSSSTGNPVERLAFYFIRALYEKIDRETMKFKGKTLADPQEVLKSPKTTQIAFHKLLPLSQIAKFAGFQAIVEHVEESRKIHIVDLQINNGLQCTILMQALASRVEHPLEYLKITAVGTNSRPMIEETGRHLTSFAQSLSLKFLFNVVVVDDILDLNKKLFDLDEDETIAVYAEYVLMNWIARPNCLDKLMQLIRTLNPCVMIVCEVEANCNSPIFVERFVEALFFYGAFFDSLADCLKNDDENRMAAESTNFSSAIRNIVATEGDERKIRHVSIDVWRAYFARFGLFEVELSMSSIYQANLVLKNFMCGDSCTLDTKDKRLVIGWKGTPLSSLSAWKFQRRCLY